MEEFRKKLKTRVAVMGTAVVLVGAVFVVLWLAHDSLPAIPDFLRGFQMGAFLGLELMLVAGVARSLAALRNDEALKKMQVWEADERRRMIAQKAGSTGMVLSYAALIAAAVVAGFFNPVVFYTLLAATASLALLQLALKLYYSRKY